MKDIRKRISSVRNTTKITGAMRAIAASRLKKLQSRIIGARMYSEGIRELALQVASKTGEITNPAFQLRKKTSHITIFVISVERGFCGGLDERIAKQIKNFTEMMNGRGVKTLLYVAGTKGSRVFKKHHMKFSKVDIGIEDPLLSIKLENVVRHLNNLFLNGETDQIILAHNRFLSVTEQMVTLNMFLPVWVRPDERPIIKNMVDFICEPDKAAVEEFLLKEVLKSMLYQALLEGRTSEMAARLIAMGKALQNADKMIEKLTRRYHSVRQGSVTKELLDIVGGSEAFEAYY